MPQKLTRSWRQSHSGFGGPKQFFTLERSKLPLRNRQVRPKACPIAVNESLCKVPLLKCAFEHPTLHLPKTFRRKVFEFSKLRSFVPPPSYKRSLVRPATSHDSLKKGTQLRAPSSVGPRQLEQSSRTDEQPACLATSEKERYELVHRRLACTQRFSLRSP